MCRHCPLISSCTSQTIAPEFGHRYQDVSIAKVKRLFALPAELRHLRDRARETKYPIGRNASIRLVLFLQDKGWQQMLVCSPHGPVTEYLLLT